MGEVARGERHHPFGMQAGSAAQRVELIFCALAATRRPGEHQQVRSISVFFTDPAAAPDPAAVALPDFS